MTAHIGTLKGFGRARLVREPHNDFPQPGQIKFELPTEEHQRITELCRRIQVVERQIAELAVVRDNLNDDQELEVSFEDLIQLGFGPEHYRTT